MSPLIERRIMKKRIDIVKLIPQIKSLFLIVFGTVILAFGTAIFLIPFDLIAGGVSGIAIVVDNLISSDSVTVDLLVTLLTWGLFLIGLAVLGKSFAAKTLISTIVYPIFVSLFMRLSSPLVLGGYFYLMDGNYGEIAFLIAAIFGGVLVGVGCALTFLGGGSTGGTDVVAFAICKLFPRAKSSVVIFCVDAAIIAFGVFVINDIVVSILGICSAFVSALVIDKIFLGGNKAFIAEIITTEHEAINRMVIERMGRTTTKIEVTGGYTGKRKVLLKVSFTMPQYREILNIVNVADKNAFVTVHRAYEVSGEGFSRN